MIARDDKLLSLLRTALLEGPPLELAVLFGSRAKGLARARSDVDVGILPLDRSLPLHEELSLASTLSGAVGKEVDLVRLDGEDLLLGREVALHGCCLHESRPGLFAAWRADALSRALDFEETIRPHRESFLRRLAGIRQ